GGLSIKPVLSDAAGRGAACCTWRVALWAWRSDGEQEVESEHEVERTQVQPEALGQGELETRADCVERAERGDQDVARRLPQGRRGASRWIVQMAAARRGVERVHAAARQRAHLVDAAGVLAEEGTGQVRRDALFGGETADALGEGAQRGANVLELDGSQRFAQVSRDGERLGRSDANALIAAVVATRAARHRAGRRALEQAADQGGGGVHGGFA